MPTEYKTFKDYFESLGHDEQIQHIKRFTRWLSDKISRILFNENSVISGENYCRSLALSLIENPDIYIREISLQDLADEIKETLSMKWK